jgi:hypothetical protein
LAKEVNSYRIPAEIPTQRLLRNRNGDTSSALDHRIIFLSVVRDPKEPPVFVDIHKQTVSSPDLSIEFLMEQNLSDAEMVWQVQNRVEIMKPRLGGTVVLMDPKSNSESIKITENIAAFYVGLEPSGFLSVINKFI